MGAYSPTGNGLDLLIRYRSESAAPHVTAMLRLQINSDALLIANYILNDN